MAELITENDCLNIWRLIQKSKTKERLAYARYIKDDFIFVEPYKAKIVHKVILHSEKLDIYHIISGFNIPSVNNKSKKL